MNMVRTHVGLALLSVGLTLSLVAGCTGDAGRRAFEQGLREYERGRNVRAIAMLEKSLNLRPASPDSAAAHYYIGLAARKLGRIERAIEAFEASRRQDPDAVEPVYALAVLYFEGGDFERAQPLFEECVRRAPNDPRPLEFLARIHLRNGRVAVARRTLLAALERDASSARILTELALVEHAAGDTPKAIFFLERALQRDARYAPALYNMAWLQLNVASNRAEAMRYLQQVVAVETNEARRLEASALLATLQPSVEPVAAVPSAATPRTRTPPATPAVPPSPTTPAPNVTPATSAGAARGPSPNLDDVLAQAKKLAQQGKTDEALELCLKCASEAEKSGDQAAQEKALRQALNVGFDRSTTHLAWGRLLATRGDWTNALRSFKQAVILERENVDAHRALADAASRLGEYDAALVSLRQLVQLQPESPDAWWDMAVLYDEKIKTPHKAAESFRDFTRRFPGDPRVVKAQKRLQELEPPPAASASPPSATTPSVTTTASAPVAKPAAPAMPRIVASRPTGEARLNIRRPVVRNPQAAVQAYNRGTLYQQRGEWDQAIYYYTRALENDDTFVTAYFNLAAVYWARGDHMLAKEAYRRALELEPEAPAVRFNLALLHYELREWEAAIRELKALLERAPDYAQAHYLLGLVYAQDPQQIALAKEHYRKFLELAPNDLAAPAVQQWLRQQ